LLVGGLVAGPQTRPFPDQDAIGRARAAAREAYERKDLPGFLEHSRALVSLAPRSASALYNLACARSLTGDGAGAVLALGRLADWGVAFDLAADADFDPVRATPGFAAVEERMKELHEPIGHSPAAFSIPRKDMLAEGVAHDPVTGAFFVTGVHRRNVVRVDASGRATDFVAEASDGLCSAQAAVADASRRALWVTSGCSPLMAGYRDADEGRSFLLEYDLDRGTLRRRLAPPREDGRVSDMALGPGGVVYVSDDRRGRLYRLRPGDERLEVVVDEGVLVSPQGLAVEPGGASLFAADYVQGIVRVDTGTGASTFLEAPADVLLTGIDGLVLAGDSLVGIQNGIRPHRVVRLRLDPARRAVLELRVLERAHPAWDEPTLGVLVGPDLFYVANSQYRRFDDHGRAQADALRAPTVLRLHLDWMAPER